MKGMGFLLKLLLGGKGGIGGIISTVVTAKVASDVTKKLIKTATIGTIITTVMAKLKSSGMARVLGTVGGTVASTSTIALLISAVGNKVQQIRNEGLGYDEEKAIKDEQLARKAFLQMKDEQGLMKTSDQRIVAISEFYEQWQKELDKRKQITRGESDAIDELQKNVGEISKKTFNLKDAVSGMTSGVDAFNNAVRNLSAKYGSITPENITRSTPVNIRAQVADTSGQLLLIRTLSENASPGQTAGDIQRIARALIASRGQSVSG